MWHYIYNIFNFHVNLKYAGIIYWRVPREIKEKE